MAGEPYVAGVDLGTTRMKLHVYDREGRLVHSEAAPAPLRWRRGEAWHDPHELRGALERLKSRALRMGAVAVGVSLYRASVSSWLPGGADPGPVVLWLDRRRHEEAWRRLPLAGRLASRVPPFDRVLAPYSPLPLIADLYRRGGGARRAWTLDALIHEWVGAGYTSEPTGAALTGLVNPRTLRPIPLAARLAGAPGIEVPEIGYNTLPDAPGGVAAIVSDQQAGLVGLACEAPGCLKVSLGTGFFADAPTRGPPPLTPPRGLIPIVAYRTHRRGVLWGLESYAPGAGLGAGLLAGAAGGWERLHRAGPRECREEWEGGLLLPYPAGPGAGAPGAQRVVLAGNPAVSSGWDLACSIIAGVAAVALHLVALHRRGFTRTYLAGSLARIPLVRRAVAEALEWRVEYCPEDPTPRGAAGLAAEALEGEPLPPQECTPLPRGGGGYTRVAGALECIAREGPASREAGACMEELRSLMLELLVAGGGES